MATGGENYDLGTRNFYQLLDVKHDASDKEIKQAFRAKARMFHPDKTLNVASEDIMKALNEAKSVLLDKEKRAEYDENLDFSGVLTDPKGFLLSGT